MSFGTPSVKVEVANNLTPDHDHTRPVDVLVHNWSQGKPATFDFSVTSPLNSLNLSEAGVSSGAAAEASVIRKHNRNDGKCGDLGWVCILWLLRPMVRGVKRLLRVLPVGITTGNHLLQAKVCHHTRPIWQTSFVVLW